MEVLLNDKTEYRFWSWPNMLKPNGPAIWGGCVTRREHRVGSLYPAPAGPESCHGARRVWRTFCRHGTNFIEHYACRGTKLIGASKLSRYTKYYCMQMRVSG